MDDLQRHDQPPVTGNLITDLIRKHRSKKGLHDMKESHPPLLTHKQPFKSLTDIHTSDDGNSSSVESTSCLQLRVIHLTQENKSLREELERTKQSITLNVCSGKLLKLIEQTECLANEVQVLRKQLEDCTVQKDFYMRAYNSVKKDNEVLVKQLACRRKQLDVLKSEIRQQDSSARKRTSSQSPKNMIKSKQRLEDETLKELVSTLKSELKATSFRNLEETLKKLQSKLQATTNTDQNQRKQYFGQYSQPKYPKK